LYIPGEIQAFYSYYFFPDPLQEAGKAWEAPSTLANLSGYYFPSGPQIASTRLSTRDQRSGEVLAMPSDLRTPPPADTSILYGHDRR